MLYVLNGSIAVVLFVLIFAFGVKLSKKSASKMKRGAIFPALVGLCTAVLSFLFLFFLEGRVLSYPNPQAAYQANHFGQIDAVTEGAYSTLVVSQDGGANSAVTILPKDGDTWTYDGDTSLDMDEEAIDSMLSTLSSLTAIEEISDYTDLKEFGFDQPEDLISYTTSEGSVSLFVGNKNDTLNAYYIISADGGSIYLTETSLADAFSKTIEELTVTEDTESTETVENTEE